MGGRRPASGAGSYFNASSNPRVAATGQLYRGFVWTEGDFAATQFVRQVHFHELDRINVANRISRIITSHDRCGVPEYAWLAFQYYIRAQEPFSCEQQFMDLWTVIELYPMAQESDKTKKRRLLTKVISDFTGISLENVALRCFMWVA